MMVTWAGPGGKHGQYEMELSDAECIRRAKELMQCETCEHHHSRRCEGNLHGGCIHWEPKP